MARFTKPKTNLKNIFAEHLRENESEPVFVLAHKRKAVMKFILGFVSIPMLAIWSIIGLEDVILALVLITAIALLIARADKEFLIGLTDKRLIIVGFGFTRQSQEVRSIELFEIKDFDSVTVKNSFWVIELLDGSVLKFTIDKKEDENPDQKENAKQIVEFLQGFKRPAYTIA